MFKKSLINNIRQIWLFFIDGILILDIICNFPVQISRIIDFKQDFLCVILKSHH